MRHVFADSKAEVVPCNLKDDPVSAQIPVNSVCGSQLGHNGERCPAPPCASEVHALERISRLDEIQLK